MGASHTDDRIRVAFVITELEVGGAERCLANLATGLDRDRFAPVVYSLAPRPKPAQEQLALQLEAAGVPVRFIGATSKWQVLSAVKKLAKHLDEQQPHLVQAFLHHANVVGTLAAARCGIEHVVTGIRVADPSRWRQRVERFVCRKVAEMVCVSESVAHFAREKMQIEAARMTVIPNGIDLTMYQDVRPADLSQFGFASGQRAIVYVGRLDKQKGVDWLLQLAPRLLHDIPSHDLLLVGEGTERLALEAQASALGIWQRVHFAGWRPDVKEILRAADLLILPSRWEGMPNVLLEAMASRLPVVSTRVEGVEEILGPLASAQSVAVGDEQDFISKVSSFTTNSEAATSQGALNWARVEAEFSLSAMIATYARLYDSLVQSR